MHSILHDNPAQAVVIKLERKRLRSELIQDEEGKEDFFGFQAKCIRKFGNAAGIYARQLTFWDGKGMDPEGWIYKSEAEMEAETGLSRRSQREARKVLTGCEVLEEKRQGLPRRLFYRLNLERLVELLQIPGSTLNQWKRGMKKDPKTGTFYRSDESTLNHDYRQDGNTDLTRQDGNTDLASEDDSTDPASRDGNRDLTREVGNRDLASEDDNTDRAITESTSREYLRRTSEGTSKSSFKESSFQEAAGAQNRATPPPQTDKEKEEKTKEDSYGPIVTEAAFQDLLNEEEDPTTSSPHQPNVDPKMISEVRRVMENGRSSPAALKHYRDGRISVEEVAEWVSLDATRSQDAAKTLLPAVRLILEESAGVA
jgi:hypothetical protein